MNEIEKIVESLPGDKVTKEQIESRIKSVDYHVLPKSTVTVCNITLDNEFSVRGESACVDPTNYRKEVGEHYAYEKAFAALWPLFGFLLSESRFKNSNEEEHF